MKRVILCVPFKPHQQYNFHPGQRGGGKSKIAWLQFRLCLTEQL
jgi:hypothetical protein